MTACCQFELLDNGAVCFTMPVGGMTAARARTAQQLLVSLNTLVYGQPVVHDEHGNRSGFRCLTVFNP